MFKRFLPELRKHSLAAGRPASLADLMEEFWKSPFEGFPWRDTGYPAVDVSEDDKEVTVKAELPGLEAKDVELTLESGVLTIRGEKKFEGEEKKENYHRIERSYGSFVRAVPLPREVKSDKVKAKFDKGVLTVTMPKAEKAETRNITIE
ncbi:MAG TPA: Hsp20/alpha crystallin family protein [Desulfovibrio sp.]|jgi:HSP20 family protein|nr:Hsp20/alpha crystallin family protein [Desulfovibrio sp.]